LQQLEVCAESSIAAAVRRFCAANGIQETATLVAGVAAGIRTHMASASLRCVEGLPHWPKSTAIATSAREIGGEAAVSACVTGCAYKRAADFMHAEEGGWRQILLQNAVDR
jgi:hypothetical protein